MAHFVFTGVAMNEPSFDRCGYPTRETLQAIEDWPFEKLSDLLPFLKDAWRYPECVREGQRSGIKVIELVTGGWSGNESLISALNRNFLIWSLCWVCSYRGGLHAFDFEKNI